MKPDLAIELLGDHAAGEACPARDAFEAMPQERLEAEITELAAQLAAAECRWLRLVGGPPP